MNEAFEEVGIKFPGQIIGKLSICYACAEPFDGFVMLSHVKVTQTHLIIYPYHFFDFIDVFTTAFVPRMTIYDLLNSFKKTLLDTF